MYSQQAVHEQEDALVALEEEGRGRYEDGLLDQDALQLEQQTLVFELL
jgi:hypothetical protein